MHASAWHAQSSWGGGKSGYPLTPLLLPLVTSLPHQCLIIKVFYQWLFCSQLTDMNLCHEFTVIHVHESLEFVILHINLSREEETGGGGGLTWLYLPIPGGGGEAGWKGAPFLPSPSASFLLSSFSSNSSKLIALNPVTSSPLPLNPISCLKSLIKGLLKVSAFFSSSYS